MKNITKGIALALGSVLAIAAFAACGESTGATTSASATICYDNLGSGYVSKADTQVTVKGAKNLVAYDASGKKVSSTSSVATYKNGVFTAVSEGTIVYSLSDGTKGQVDVVPAYATAPGEDWYYTGSAGQLANETSGETVLSNSHDPSLLEVKNSAGKSVYYIFSTGWDVGNDVHKSTDGMLTWEYLGPVTQKGDWGDSSIFPSDLVDWMNVDDNSGDIQWWASDIVEAPDGGYWFYTCLVMSDDIIASTKLSSSKGTDFTPSTSYSRACIVMYYISDLDKIGEAGAVEYRGVLMQSAIPQDNNVGTLDINSIDPQIIYDDEGNMYMAYGSFGTGNWMLELDPETGLRKDSVYTDEDGDGYVDFKDWEWVRAERNKMVSGDGNDKGSSSLTNSVAYTKFMAGEEVTSDFYGTLISVGAMEAPVIARHDGVKVADETATYDEQGEPEGVEGTTYYYSMHSYNGLSADYQMWGGRSESVWGVYKSTGGGVVYNVGVGSGSNQGNKYMGAFSWRSDSKANGTKEIDVVLTGHNDLFTSSTGVNIAAYITRTYTYSSVRFCVQLHQYYLNSLGDICINPNRYAYEIDRSVSEEELLALTDGGKFEMVVLTNSADWSSSTHETYNVSFEVVMESDHTITKDGTKIGTWQMYGKGYIKYTFDSALDGSNGYNSGETVYYGVVRPAWLSNRNQSGFTISCLSYGDGNQSMSLFLNSYSTITGDGFVGS